MWNFQKIDFFLAKMVDDYVRNDVPKRFSKKKICSLSYEPQAYGTPLGALVAPKCLPETDRFF